MSEEIGTVTNRYVTVRTGMYNLFFVNIINYDGTHYEMGKHGYSHKRSARRAAIALAKKLDVSYRQDLEHTDSPQAFTAEVIRN
ncbi:hypothetical protein LCGC14_1365900 [marine sediment metagenome]|uniref:Uncharacterized protein n=1 Tax=marine sediment metagenome TaxID=412755 RepID=A0A0F9MM11_9ZZZZ